MQNPVLLAIKSAVVWGLSCSLLQLQCERTWLGSGKGFNDRTPEINLSRF